MEYELNDYDRSWVMKAAGSIREYENAGQGVDRKMIDSFKADLIEIRQQISVLERKAAITAAILDELGER